MKHYAGEVLYNAEGFLDKNRDSVGEACRDLLAGSSVPLVREVFNDSSLILGNQKGTFWLPSSGVICPFRHSVWFYTLFHTKFETKQKIKLQFQCIYMFFKRDCVCGIYEHRPEYQPNCWKNHGAQVIVFKITRLPPLLDSLYSHQTNSCAPSEIYN